MRRTIVAAASLLFLSGSALAQKAPCQEPGAASAASYQSVHIAETQVVAITRALMRALTEGDRSVWERYLAPDFLLLDRDGSTQARQAVLADIKPLPRGYTLAFALKDIRVLDLGNSLMVVFLVEETESVFGQLLRVSYRNALTFSKEPSRWQLKVFQYVEIPKDAEPTPISADTLQQYVGEYSAGEGLKYTVRVRENRLFLERANGSEVELVPESESVFYSRGTEFRKIFVRSTEGQVVELIDRRKGSDLRFRKVGAPQP